MSINKPMTLYLADDHPIVVDGLIEILKSNEGLKVLDTAFNGEQLIHLLEKRVVDLVILDINMPKMNGIQCTRQIKERFPTVKVIILTMYPEKSYSDQLIKIGADGCILKSRSSKDLLEAIERVASGKSYFDWIADFNSGSGSDGQRQLSEREIEVVKRVILGKTSREIANELFISEDTVKTHRKNIFKKLKLHHITDLMTFAMNNGIA